MMAPQTMHEGFTRDHPSSDPPKEANEMKKTRKISEKISRERGRLERIRDWSALRIAQMFKIFSFFRFYVICNILTF